MKVRRVVTGHSIKDKSIIASDMQIEGIPTFWGDEFHQLWGADTIPTFPDNGSPHPSHAYFPPVGGFRFGLFTVAPGTYEIPKNMDEEKELREIEEKLPGMLSVIEPGSTGMHTTNTIDFEYIISGEVWLELDEGVEVHLRPGDTVVQNGTRHAWHNKGTEPCRIVVCIVGAHRS